MILSYCHLGILPHSSVRHLVVLFSRLVACAMSYAICRRNALLRFAFKCMLPGYLPVSSLGVYLGVSIPRCLSPSLVDPVVLLLVYYHTRLVLWLGSASIGVGRLCFRSLHLGLVCRCLCRGDSGCAVYTVSRPYPQSLTPPLETCRPSEDHVSLYY